MSRILSMAAVFASAALLCHAQTVRVIRFSEGKAFHMGDVTAVRIIQPDAGAKQLTLNYSFSQPGREFAQHVHDYSDDTILVLEGQADLRQGDSRTPIKAGTCAFVPTGQIHGTITTAPNTVMISFQVPPDLALYSGARDSSRPGAAPPKGVITPGAVKYVDFAGKNGFFVYPGMVARRAAAAQRVLNRGESFKTTVDPGGEQLFFVWKGAIVATAAGHQYKAGEKDTIFATGPVSLEVSGDSAQPATVIQVESPPRSGEVWK